jgi:hypothetical protein
MGEERAKTNPDTESALAQVERDRLLEGEDPTSTYLEDASHWIAVYSELLLFKERLVDAAEQSMRNMTEPPARNEAAQVDLPVLLAQRTRLRQRLDFWKERSRELSGSD